MTTDVDLSVDLICGLVNGVEHEAYISVRLRFLFIRSSSLTETSAGLRTEDSNLASEIIRVVGLTARSLRLASPSGIIMNLASFHSEARIL